MSDELRVRVQEILEAAKFSSETAIAYVTKNLDKESAPFNDELRLNAWKEQIRAHNHGSRVLKEPERKFKPGATAGSAIETEASKKLHADFEKKKAQFPSFYVLAGSGGVSLFTATVTDIDDAIKRHQANVDGNVRQIRFLEAAREILVKTPNGKFRKTDFDVLIALAKDHGIIL